MATSGRAVLVRAVPLFGAVAIASTIIFAGHGLDASDVTAMMQRSLAARVLLWLVWVALATSPISAAFDAQGTRTLRSIAITNRRSRAAIVGLLVVLFAIAQAPLIVLFARGQSASAAFATALIAVSLCVTASSRNVVVFAFASALVVFDRLFASCVLAPALACISVHHAWRGAFYPRSASFVVRRHRSHSRSRTSRA